MESLVLVASVVAVALVGVGALRIGTTHVDFVVGARRLRFTIVGSISAFVCVDAFIEAVFIEVGTSDAISYPAQVTSASKAAVCIGARVGGIAVVSITREFVDVCQ